MHVPLCAISRRKNINIGEKKIVFYYNPVVFKTTNRKRNRLILVTILTFIDTLKAIQRNGKSFAMEEITVNYMKHFHFISPIPIEIAKVCSSTTEANKFITADKNNIIE